jgi:hypothetical protein
MFYCNYLRLLARELGLRLAIEFGAPLRSTLGTELGEEFGSELGPSLETWFQFQKEARRNALGS